MWVDFHPFFDGFLPVHFQSQTLQIPIQRGKHIAFIFLFGLKKLGICRLTAGQSVAEIHFLLQVLPLGCTEYVSAPPLPGAIVVNVADLMQRWTGGELKSTVGFHSFVECG